MVAQQTGPRYPVSSMTICRKKPRFAQGGLPAKREKTNHQRRVAMRYHMTFCNYTRLNFLTQGGVQSD
jgi:hypothetical protein